MEIVLLNTIEKIESVIEEELKIAMDWDVNDNADIALLKSDEGADIGLRLKSHKIYLISKSTSKELICSSDFESIAVFEEVVANLYITFYRCRLKPNSPFTLEQFINLAVTDTTSNTFVNAYEFYYLMKCLVDNLSKYKEIINSVDAQLESLILHRVRVNFTDNFGKSHKLEVYYNHKENNLQVYFRNTTDTVSLDIVKDWALDDIAEHITNNVIKSLRRTIHEKSRNTDLIKMVDYIREFVPDLVGDIWSNESCKLERNGVEATLTTDFETFTFECDDFRINSKVATRVKAFALFCANVLNEGALKGIYETALEASPDGAVTVSAINKSVLFTFNNKCIIEIARSDINIGGMLHFYDSRYNEVYSLYSYKLNVDIIKEKLFNAKKGDMTMRLVALKRDNTLVGFRFKGSESYDISVDVAKKFGITSIKTSTFINLENSNGLLLSKSEIASGTIVKDVSDDLEFVEKLVKAIGGTPDVDDNSEMTVEKMKKIIKDNVDFKSLKKNSGIYEFYSIDDKSLGISYEDIDDVTDVYIYNIFLGSEYLNIDSRGYIDNPISDDVLNELVEEWNKY